MAKASRASSYSSDIEARRIRSRSRTQADLEKIMQVEATSDTSDDDHYNHYDRYDATYSDADYSNPSSRSASSPMLNPTKVFTRPTNNFKLPRIRLKGQNPMRWICLGLAGALVLFVMNLVRMSWSSDAALQNAILEEKIAPPPPPAWEAFPFLSRYWGGLRSLVPYDQNEPEYPRDFEQTSMGAAKDGHAEQNNSREMTKRSETELVPESVLFNPYPNYTTSEYTARYGQKVDCFLDEAGTVQVPGVRMYHGRPNGFPEPVMGDPRMLGMRHDICYDRFSRLGPYGLGYSLSKGGTGAMMNGDNEGADLVWSQRPEVDYRDVKWRDVQERCYAANRHRFNTSSLPPYEEWRAMQMNGQFEKSASPLAPSGKPRGELTVPRTAIVVRVWHGFDWSPEEIMYLRSLMTELSLNTGGEYTLHFLVQLKDNNGPIWNNQEAHDRYLYDALPPEFRGMGTLWTEAQMSLIYSGLDETFYRDLPVHGVYRSTFLPLQYFAYNHPEYDYFWNWELDVRNTGHWYHFFDSVTQWAKKQPRKYLWERNSRFYVPKEHGSWEDFSQMVRLQSEHGTNSVNNLWSGIHAGGQSSDKPRTQGDRPVWGPDRPQDNEVAMDTDPEPPTTFDKDKYEWGVGEEADLITFNPIFDPDGTTWLLADDVTGYNKENSYPPRRAAVITATRLSRKLLMTMHRETGEKHHTMFSEMWPATTALHHGLKAVYVPHPVYVDRDWPTPYLESVFNAGRNGAAGGARTSVFGDPEHNFIGTTWYYNAAFPETLWNRWLGLKMHNDGGELWEMAHEGRMCLPAILLHPVKRVELPQEGKRAD